MPISSETRHIVFLDVTAASDTNLLATLKSKGIKELYLYTEEALAPGTMKTLLELKKKLKSQDFTVHRVASSSDLFWSFKHLGSIIPVEDDNQNIVNVGEHSGIKDTATLIEKNDLSIVIGSAYFDMAKSDTGDTEDAEDTDAGCDGPYLNEAKISAFLAKRLALQHKTRIISFILSVFLTRLRRLREDWADSIIVIGGDLNLKRTIEIGLPQRCETRVSPPISIFTVTANSNAESYHDLIEEHLNKKNLFTCLKRILTRQIRLGQSRRYHPIMEREILSAADYGSGRKERALRDLRDYLEDSLINKSRTEQDISRLISEWLEMSEGTRNEPPSHNQLTNRQVLSEHRNKFCAKNRPMVPTTSMLFIQDLILEYMPANASGRVQQSVSNIDEHIKSLESAFYSYNPAMRPTDGIIYAFKELKNRMLLDGNDGNTETILNNWLEENKTGLCNRVIIAKHRNRFYSEDRPGVETSSQTFIKELQDKISTACRGGLQSSST